MHVCRDYGGTRGCAVVSFWFQWVLVKSNTQTTVVTVQRLWCMMCVVAHWSKLLWATVDLCCERLRHKGMKPAGHTVHLLLCLLSQPDA
jgi:hypothetical protein